MYNVIMYAFIMAVFSAVVASIFAIVEIEERKSTFVLIFASIFALLTVATPILLLAIGYLAAII